MGNIPTHDRTARAVWEYDPASPWVDLEVTLSCSDTLKRTEQGDDRDEPIMPSLLGERTYELWKLRAVNIADLSSGDYQHYLTIGAEISRQDRTSTTPSSSHPEAKTDRRAIYALSEFTAGQLTVNTGLRIERQETTPWAASPPPRSASATPRSNRRSRRSTGWTRAGRCSARWPRWTGCDRRRALRHLPGRRALAEPQAGTRLRIQRRGGGQGDAVPQPHHRPHHPHHASYPTPAYVNIDQVTLKGGEIEASFAAGRRGLTAGLSIVDSEDGDGLVVDTLPNDRIIIGASRQASDAWKIGGFSTFAAGRDRSDGERRAGYAVHDLYAIWTPQQGVLNGVEMRFGVDDVLDKTYTPATWASPATGRNFSISATRAF